MGQNAATIRAQMIASHVDCDYYGKAETPAWLGPFWGQGSTFLTAFEQLDLAHTLEMACGHGRHSAQVIEKIGTLTLMDVNETNISACRRRFAGRRNVRFLVNDGRSLQGVDDGSMTSVFCYDAMVHFEAVDVISYVSEVSRVLRRGGRALLHYSNNDSPGVIPFEDSAWRNYFSQSMMHHFAQRAGLSVLRSDTFAWGGRPNLDGLVLLEKS